MIRSAITTHIRTLADELTEAPEGIFTDTEIETLINLSQVNVEMDLLEFMPWYFRKAGTAFTITVNTRTYDISSDLSISDHLLFETILHNKTGERATPLVYLESPEDVQQYTYVGHTAADPETWMYEGYDTIAIDPTPAGTVASRLKPYYFRKIPDLAGDSESPFLPGFVHPLVALDVLLCWFIRDERSQDYLKIQGRYDKIFRRGTYMYSARQGPTLAKLPSLREHLNRDMLSRNITG